MRVDVVMWLVSTAGCAFELRPGGAPADADPDGARADGSGDAIDAPTDALVPDAPPSAATFTIAASNDDAMQDPGGPMLVAYSWASIYSANHWGGLRFQLTGIAQGATIHDAFLELTIDSSNEDIPNVVIAAQASPSPAAFTTTTSNISARALGTGRVTWIATDIGSGLQRTPALTALVQERVSDAAWAPGSRIAFVVDGQDGTNLEWRQYDYAPAGTYAARLRVQFTNP